MQTLAALAEPNRFRIVELLRDGPRPVNDIAVQLGMNQPQASKHLRVLKSAGVVSVRPNAQQRVYELCPESLRRMHDWLEGYRQLWDERFVEFDELLEELKQTEMSDDRK